MNLDKLLSKIRSLKLCLSAHPDYEKDSEFEDRYFDLEAIEKELQKWKIDSIERYYYFSGRNEKTYIETTFYFNPYSLERKEVVRQHSIFLGQEYNLPEWAKVIVTRNKGLESDRIF